MHDQKAAVHEQAASEAAKSGSGGYACGDRALSDQTTSGGEPVTRWVPCWSVEREASSTHEAEARAEMAAWAALDGAALTAAAARLGPRLRAMILEAP